MEKYLYLSKPEFADAWINGGKVPLSPAGKYLRQERGGIYTPDENRLLNADADVALLPPGSYSTGAKAVFSKGNTYNGGRLPDMVAVNGYQEALIHCMSNDVDADAAGRMGKVACVRILSVERLKAALDAQVGSESRAGRCLYTDEERQIDHFVKTLHDRWQNEYRLVWPGIDEERWVDLPPGIAEAVELDIKPWVEVVGRLWRRHVDGRTFDGERVELDGCMFTGCTFSPSCVLVFGATDLPAFKNCRFIGPTQWRIVGGARQMEAFMANLYHRLSKELVRDWFDHRIGEGRVVAPPAAAAVPPVAT
jgi:hypothetical protein